MNNPEDPNELDIYKRLTDIERRLDVLEKKHSELRDDYTFGRKGGGRKTRKKRKSRRRKRKKNKTKRKRKRKRRKTKRR